MGCTAGPPAPAPADSSPVRMNWMTQTTFVSQQMQRIDATAVLRRLWAEPDDPQRLDALRVAAQFERPAGGWIEFVFEEARASETTHIAEIPATVDPALFPLKRLPLLTPTEQQQRRDVWTQIVVGPTEAVAVTAPAARDLFLQPFRVEAIELIFDDRVRTGLNKPAAWLIVYQAEAVKAIYWVDPMTGAILLSKHGPEDSLVPSDYQQYPQD